MSCLSAGLRAEPSIPCGRFTQCNDLKKHRKIHTGDKPIYQCELCSTTCGSIPSLRAHVQKFHFSENPLQCKKCDKYFPDKFTLKAHEIIHLEEKCFKCELCPYSSVLQRHLKSHMLRHSDNEPFNCDICDQSFRRLEHLKRHQNSYHNPYNIPPVQKEENLDVPNVTKPLEK